MHEMRDDVAVDRLRMPTPVAAEPSAAHPLDLEAVDRMDTARRTAVVHELQAGPGNAAVQRLLDGSGDAPSETRADVVQRDVDDEEMPDEAAAG